MTDSPVLPCRDCSRETAYVDYYMVKDPVWLAAGMPLELGGRAFLCIACLEARLDRPLNRDDFTDALVNHEVCDRDCRGERLLAALAR